MSTYVSGIIARSLTPLAGIRPRIAMLFEPVQGPSRVSPDRQDTDVAVVGDRDVASEPARTRATDPDDTRNGSGHFTAKEETSPVTDNPGPSTAASRESNPRLPPQKPPERHPADVHRGTLTVAREEGEPHPSIQATVRGETGHLPEEGDVAKENRRTSAPIPGVRPALPAEPLTRAVLAHAQVSEQESRGIRKHPSFKARTPEAETTVHVTIGRIEVRAVQQPDTPRRPGAKTHAVMTLEEYLSRRSKRGNT